MSGNLHSANPVPRAVRNVGFSPVRRLSLVRGYFLCLRRTRLDHADSPSVKDRKYSWERIYKAAALEADNARVERRISVAEGTLMARLLELTDRQEDRVEGKALEKALRTLLTIKQKRLGHS